MKPHELIKVLEVVPANADLVKNQVGNLAVILDDEYIGWVDLRTAEYNPNEETT